MRSKEEILEKNYHGGFEVKSGWMFDGNVSEVFSAMDEYAKEVAIKFADWLCDTDTFRNNVIPSSEQLFNQFLQETKQS